MDYTQQMITEAIIFLNKIMKKALIIFRDELERN